MVGKDLERYRLEFNLSQREVAEVVSVSTKTIGNWSKGIGSPNPVQDEKLRKLFLLDKVDDDVKSFTEKLVKELLKENIITDSDNIPGEVIEMIVSALKLDLKQKKER